MIGIEKRLRDLGDSYDKLENLTMLQGKVTVSGLMLRDNVIRNENYSTEFEAKQTQLQSMIRIQRSKVENAAEKTIDCNSNCYYSNCYCCDRGRGLRYEKDSKDGYARYPESFRYKLWIVETIKVILTNLVS